MTRPRTLLSQAALSTALLSAVALAAEGRPERTDAQGDPLPHGALARLGTVRWRVNARDLAFLPDGKTLATTEYAPKGDLVRFWDAATGKETSSFRLPDAVTGFALSPDGKEMAVCCAWESRGVVFLSVPEGKEIRRIEETETYFRRLEFSPDGKLLAGMGHDKVVRVWDAATGKEVVRETQDVKDSRAELAFSPDGKRLAVSCGKNTLHFLAIETGKTSFRQQPDRDDLRWDPVVRFSPDGKKLGWQGEKAGTFALWDISTGERDFERPGEFAALSPDGKCIASTDAKWRRSIHLWDGGTGKELRKLAPSSGPIDLVAFSPDGKRLAAAGDCDGVLHLWDVETGKELSGAGEHQGPVKSVAFLPDGKTVVTGCADRTVRTWDVDKAAVVHRVEVGGGENPVDCQIVFSDDRKSVAVAGLHNGGELWDLDSGKKRAVLDGGKECAWEIHFAPDGKTLASRGKWACAQLWDAASGKKASGFEVDVTDVSCFAFSPDGKTLAAFRGPSMGVPELSLWDVAAGKELRKRPLPSQFVSEMTFSPDGRILAAVCRGDVRLWDAAALTDLPPVTAKEIGSVQSLAISPDGRTLAGGDDLGTIYLFEVSTACVRACLQGHRNRVTSLDFSPDGARLVSGSDDATALVWDLAGGKPGGGLPADDLTALWDDLAAADAGKAYRATWRVTSDPAASVPFLAKRLRPAKEDAALLAKLLAGLDSDEFAEREEATRRLKELGDLAGPALRAANEGVLSAEARQRVEDVLHKLEGPVEAPQLARGLRGVEALEHVGSVEARRLLEELAAGAPAARLTREAKASLQRLARRSSP
jgi:WD40 repeat protein